jgi:hypothetical protein
LVEQSSVSQALFNDIYRGENYLRKHQKLCKICNHELAPAILQLYLFDGYSYKRIIEAYGRFIPNLNLYNISNHLNYHISIQDFKEALAAKARREQIKVQEAAAS